MTVHPINTDEIETLRERAAELMRMTRPESPPESEADVAEAISEINELLELIEER